jgi:putative transposase
MEHCATTVAQCSLTISWMKRIETVKLYPTPTQPAALAHVLHITRRIYNAALQERKDAYRLRKITLTAKKQYAEITALRRESIALTSVYRECVDAALHRLDLAYAAFFRRVARSETPGFPRYKSASRWRQISFPHGNRALKFNDLQTRLRVPGLGWVKVRKGRQVPAYGRAWLVLKSGRWYAQFECERAAQPLPAVGADVGLDRGIAVLVATSDGELFENPRPITQARLRLARAQRIVAKRNRSGRNRRKAVAKVARLHEKVANQRRDRAHKISRSIVDRYDRIALMNGRLASFAGSPRSV